MKLQRYNQFVKKLNEEREMPKYDSVEDFRRTMREDEMGEDDDEMGQDDEMRVKPAEMPEKDYSDEFSKYDDDENDIDDMGDDMDDDMGDDMDDSMDDMPKAQPERYMRGDDMPKAQPERYMRGDDDMPEAAPEEDFRMSSDEQKLYDLADMLNLEVVDNQVTYGDEVVNYYSETGNLHIGSKEFETAEDAAEYLKGGEPRMARDTNESKSYRFKRKSRY